MSSTAGWLRRRRRSCTLLFWCVVAGIAGCGLWFSVMDVGSSPPGCPKDGRLSCIACCLGLFPDGSVVTAIGAAEVWMLRCFFFGNIQLRICLSYAVRTASIFLMPSFLAGDIFDGRSYKCKYQCKFTFNLRSETPSPSFLKSHVFKVVIK